MTLAQALTLNGILFALVCGLAAYLWNDFKNRVEKRIEELVAAINTAINASAPGVILERLRVLERDYQNMHTWKNILMPKQTEQFSVNIYGAIGNLRAEVDRRLINLEASVFHNRK